MTHANLQSLLSMASVTHGQSLTYEERHRPVRVQWDLERGPRLDEKPYRNIQIRIGREVSRRWAEEWIESIEDVTEMALRLKGLADGEGKKMSVQELVEAGAMPVERVYEVSDELSRVLKMDESASWERLGNIAGSQCGRGKERGEELVKLWVISSERSRQGLTDELRAILKMQT